MTRMLCSTVIALCLRSSTGLSQKQVQGVKKIITAHIEELVDISTILTARTLATYAFDLLQPSVGALQDSHEQFVFLRSLLEPALLRDETASRYAALPENEQSAFTEKYVQLMCKHDPTHVADYVECYPRVICT